MPDRDGANSQLGDIIFTTQKVDEEVAMLAKSSVPVSVTAECQFRAIDEGW